MNVPARGVGKSVMDALDTVDPGSGEETTPLLLAGLQPAPSPRSLWARLVVALDRRQLPPRALASLKTFRDVIVSLAGKLPGKSVSIAIGLVLDRTGYLAGLREERSEDAEGRIENLMELVSAAREYESRDDDPSLGGFVDRLSLLSEADEADGAREARVWLMSMHAAKGLEFPVVVVAGMEEGLFPHSRSAEDEEEVEEERRLCYVCLTRARERLVLTGASRRRVFGEYQSTEPSRFLGEVPEHLVDRIQPVAPPRWMNTGYETRNPYARRYGGDSRNKVKDGDDRGYSYESEDQSAAGAMRTGTRVRHRQFGVGTIVDVEDQGDDVKLTVRFASVGTKKLLARFAGLEPA